MIKSVCVYCSSSDSISSIYYEEAEKLGTLLGKRRLHVINGAGNNGLMNAVSNVVLKEGGTVTGVIPDFMVKNGWCHQGLTQVIKTNTMHERKKTIADISDAAIALPGGYGTMEELLEIITWKQLGLYNKPVIILNTNHFYDPLLEMFRQATEEKFIHPEPVLWNVVQTANEIMEIL